ncbi:vWFA domain-containing protein [Achlya hypogyna]|uniref:VWFA domain-containing protein n=1 Tax=Achlya hypogyna TaxID=1202772 RepID=A0A1V9YR86_ACHHY|nr:vWFA domain-containing protein [Achlya hypogyna]
MAHKEVDLYLVCDATGSMGSYVESLHSTLRQIFALTKLLFHGRLKVHMVAYKDYCDGAEVLTYVSQRTHTNAEMLQFVRNLTPRGGGDFPEAVKTALNHVLATIASHNVDAIVLLFTDAPPHHIATASRFQGAEIAAIGANPRYTAGHDWFSLQAAFTAANTPVYTFHSRLEDTPRTLASAAFYALLGPLVILDDVSASVITEATIGLLLQLMDQPFDNADHFNTTKISHNGRVFDNSFSLSSETNLPDLFALMATQSSFAFAPLPSMAQDLDVLPALFRDDLTYQAMVYNVFRVIFAPDLVLAVTYNPVLGKLWRLVSSRRLDGRLQELSTRLSQCVPALEGDARRQVTAWIADARDDRDLVRAAVAATPVTSGFFVLDATADTTIDVAALRSLARAPRPGALQQVQALLTHLQWVEHAPDNLVLEDGTPAYLPSAMADSDLFRYLPHLLCPGVTFSTRGSVVLALLCALSEHALLGHRARAHLNAIRGTWLPLDSIAAFPELVSLEFVKIVHRGREYLTPAEAHVYDTLHTIYRLRLGATKAVDIATGFVPTAATWHPDHKAKCHSCGFLVSCSLFASPTTCALCVTDGVPDAIARHRSAASPPSQSRLVECVGCHALYAVVCIGDLRTAPKCHFCRQYVRPSAVPTVACSSCANKFVDPAGLYASGRLPGAWTCAVCCETPARATTLHSATLEGLFAANPALAAVAGWTKPKKCEEFVRLAFQRDLNYFKLAMRYGTLLLAPGPRGPGAQPDALRWAGKPVQRPAEVCAAVADALTRDSLHELCLLCCDEVPLPALETACGRCATRACGPCLERWYGEARPGALVLPTQLACAFCRRAPTLAVLRRYNRPVCALTAGFPQPWSPAMYYGWCLACYAVKPMVARTCTRAAPRNIADFTCDDCVESQRAIAAAMAHEAELAHEEQVAAWQRKDAALRDSVKRCPGCKRYVEKSGGEPFQTAIDTYDHLYTAHKA